MFIVSSLDNPFITLNITIEYISPGFGVPK